MTTAPKAAEPTGAPFPTVAVVIPALNEAESIAAVIRDLPPVGWVFVVDNGSTDQTAQIARNAGATVLHEPRRGYGAACQAGIDAAARAGSEILVILDGDHADYPEDLPALLGPILAGERDLVLSDRTAGAETGSLLPHQRHGNALATFLMAQVTGHRYRDMGPFRAIRMSSLLAMGMCDQNYGWNVEMQMKAVWSGLRIAEVPMRYRKRTGVSKISGTVRGTLRAGTKILWSVWRYRR